MNHSQSPVLSTTRTPLIACIALFLVIQINVPALSQQPNRAKRSAVPIEDTAQFQKRLASFMRSAREKAGFSGVVMVARKGKVAYQGAFGYSHLGLKRPNTPDTPFRIASLSKQFTAAAILHLEAEGKLSVDDPVHRYLPEFDKESHRGITIYHLLTHTSGLPKVPEDKARRARWIVMSKRATPVEEYVGLATEVPLKYETGQGFKYSNFGYRVLSAVIARVTGKAYADFMEEDVFKPLGMNQTGVARISRPEEEAKVAEGLKFERFDSDTREPIYVLDDSGRNYGAGYGSGGIYTSANDLIRWDRVLAGDDFLPAKQRIKLFQPARAHYACGWIVKQSGLDGRLYQTHSGANEGFFSKMMRIPEDDLVIIAVGNVRMTRDEVLEQLFRLCRSLPYVEL